MTEVRKTDEKPVSLAREAIVKEAKRIEENCRNTSKSHFVAAEFWGKFHFWVGIPTTVLAAAAGATAFAGFSGHNIIAGSLAVIVMILTAVTTFLNPREKSDIHLRSGNGYDSLLTKTRIFRTIDCRIENSEELLTDRLRLLSEERDRLNRECPQAPKRAFIKAKKGIEAGEADYEVDGNK
jgi:hypothetical protein